MEKDNRESIELALQSLGWNSKEARVYIAILKLGKGTVSEIARLASISRTNTYNILYSLCQRKVISISGREPKQEYAAEDPEAVSASLRREAGGLAERIKKSEELVPELTLMHAKQNRPKVKFYEGTNGLEQAYEDTLTSTEPIRAYASVDDVHKALPNYFPDYYKRRANKNIAIRAIFPKTEESTELATHNAEEKREVAFVPSEKYDFSPEINIYDNKVMIASWRERLGIIIESAEIAHAMKKIFELAWAESKRLDADLRK